MFFNVLIKTKRTKFINDHFILNKDKKINLNDIDTLYVAFNEYAIPLASIIHFYDTEFDNNSTKWLEVLPSIYGSKTDKYFYIFIRNVRDTFYVLNEQDDFQYNSDSLKIVYYNIDIDPTFLPYPTMLRSGCPIWSEFNNTLFLDTTPHYSILKHEDILEVTANCEKFKKKYCKDKNGNCYKNFLEALLNNKFEFYSDNAIQIAKYKECYNLGEGKHRICGFKRYNKLDKIKVDLTSYDYNYHSSPNKKPITNYRENITPYELLEDYYKAYEKIGIEKKEAKDISEKVGNENFIEYFEGKYGKDIFQIINDLKK